MRKTANLVEPEGATTRTSRRQGDDGKTAADASAPCIFAGDPVSLPSPFRNCSPHASIQVFPADPARDPQGGRDRLAPADAARWHNPPGIRWNLRLFAARPPGIGENLPDRARGAGSRGRDRNAHADPAAGRAVARERPLRGLRQGNAAYQGPAWARPPLWPDQRGDDHRNLSQLCSLVQGLAAQPLPYPMEIPG